MAIEVPIPEVEISDTEQRISRIREYKERMNYTFKDIAEMSGVPVSTVKKVLTRATMRPRRQTVEKMMKALGIRESIHNAAEANGELYAQAVPGYISGTSAEKLEDLIPEVEAGIEEHLKNNGKSGDGNRRKRYTIEDYYRLPDECRVELIDGVFYDMASPSRPHQKIGFEIGKQLDACIEENGLEGHCFMYVAPSDVALGEKRDTIVQPDVYVHCNREKEIQEEHATDVLPPDPKEEISRMTDQQLFKELGINNVVERNNVCEAVNILDRKVLNWGAYLEDTYVEEDDGSHFPKKGIVLIIRSPRDGTVHTYTYNFSKDPNINVLDYSDFGQERCITAFIGSIDINDAFNQVDEEGNEKEMLFNNKRDFHLCISSDDALSTYGRRRMLTIKADGHNSSAVSLVDMESEDNKCQ